jgi:hypothetical protein
MNYFVSVVRSDASQGPLYGPYESYKQAQEVLRAALIAGDNEEGPVDITAKVKKAIKEDGFWSFDGGGGIYIVQAEEFSAEADED